MLKREICGLGLSDVNLEKIISCTLRLKVTSCGDGVSFSVIGSRSCVIKILRQTCCSCKADLELSLWKAAQSSASAAMA